MRVPLIKPDLPPFSEIESELREAIESGRVTNFGKHVQAFEAEMEDYLGTRVVTLSSGTAGLLLTLQALGVQPGSKVIVPSFTFMATVQAILYAGATPLYAEVDNDLTVSVDDVARLLAHHADVDAVLAVHTYGLPCQVDALDQVCARASGHDGQAVVLIYDAAHAFGSRVAGKPVGNFGRAEIFSLSVTKALVSVEGGAVATHDDALAERLKRMRNYGVEANYDTHWPGLNAKMSELHAIIGRHNLKRLDERLATRKKRAGYYTAAIHGRTGCQVVPSPDSVTHTYKDYTVLLPEALAARRQEVMDFLSEQDVETRAYFYPAVHEQVFFRRFADRPLPRTEALSRRVLTLPFYTEITEPEMDHVVEVLGAAERAFA